MGSERDARCIPPVASPSFFLHCLPIVFLPALPTQQNHYATARGLGCNPYNGRMEGCGSETRVSRRPSLHASSTHRQLNHTTTRVQNCRTSILRRTNAQARPHSPDDYPVPHRLPWPIALLRGRGSGALSRQKPIYVRTPVQPSIGAVFCITLGHEFLVSPSSRRRGRSFVPSI